MHIYLRKLPSLKLPACFQLGVHSYFVCLFAFRRSQNVVTIDWCLELSEGRNFNHSIVFEYFSCNIGN
jgi:hypothetical protein